MDYKEKYEETLRKAKEYYANVPGSREFLDNIFPQLSESEDEKIRKEIIEYFHGCIRRNKKSGFRVEQIKGWIAYLEKQKDILEERAKNITANMLEDGIEGIQRELIEFLSNTVNASWVDVIKSADAYAERIRNIIEKQKEQNPAEWSEEDKLPIDAAIYWLERRLEAERAYDISTRSYPLSIRETVERLKSLRPHWKPSNHELGALRTAISILTEERNFPRAGKHLQDILDHFEGKETRHDWKPSELQMFALDSAILMFHNLKRGGDKEELQSLYNDLKKL